MSDSYPIPSASARAELRVVNSRFIGSADYTPTVDAAKAFIAQVRDEFPDATHHAYAYMVGYGSSVTAGMSDAGEPPGTAGRPMMAVVRGSGLGDVTVVVTRFFGGTLLGTGGLVRAYSDTAKEVLDVLPRTERVEKQPLTVRVGYAAYTPVRQVLESFEADFLGEDFAADVSIRVSVPLSQSPSCIEMISSVTAGQAEVTLQSDSEE